MQCIVCNALYNILHSIVSSILIAPPLLVSILNRYYSYASNTIKIILSEYPWYRHCQTYMVPVHRRNNAMFERRFVDFKTMLVLFTRVRSKILSVSMVFMCDDMGLTEVATSLLAAIGPVFLQRFDAVASFHPIAAQLSKKAALLLEKNLATASW